MEAPVIAARFAVAAGSPTAPGIVLRTALHHQGTSHHAAPDLVFTDQQKSRLIEIEPLLDAPERLDGHTPLHRLTVFLTYRCNLRCSFCKTVPLPLSGGAPDFTVESFERVLDAHADTPIRHVHLTGGEAPLHRDASAIVRIARAHGVTAVSTTSGGALAPAIYERLLDAGLTEIRVSISALDGRMAEEMGGNARAWARTMATIARLAELRRSGRAFHLVLNAVVGRRNRERLPELVRHLVGLGPDDVKLIQLVQERRTLGDFPGRARVIAEIEDDLRALPPRAFPLLRLKLGTIFEPDAIGLRRAAETENPEEWRCYVALTERTVDSDRYYPCSVYLREGGAPLGRIDDPIDVQRAKLAAFARMGRCLEDPICREYCLHCTREFNVAANRGHAVAS